MDDAAPSWHHLLLAVNFALVTVNGSQLFLSSAISLKFWTKNSAAASWRYLQFSHHNLFERLAQNLRSQALARVTAANCEQPQWSTATIVIRLSCPQL